MSDRSRVRAYYASFGEREWDRLGRPGDGAVEFAVTSDALQRHLSPNSKVLDIGGGPGRYAIWLAGRGHTVSLGDLSPELLAIARRNVAIADARAGVVEIVEADACDLSRWPDASFDAALSLGPFYHLTEASEREVAAQELARVVRPGGLVFVAGMPRLAFLQRTIALADERHHLLDGRWMQRLLDQGIFENDVPGRFSLGYGLRPGELESLFATQGFAKVELLAAESLSVGIEGEVGDVIQAGGPMSERVTRLLVDLASDEHLLGGARHLLFVGQRRHPFA